MLYYYGNLTANSKDTVTVTLHSGPNQPPYSYDTADSGFSGSFIF